VTSDRTRLGIARCGIAAVLFGATTPIASRVADDTTAPILAGLLYLGAAVAVLPFVRRRTGDRAALRRGAPRLAVAVIAGGLIGPLLLAAGLSRTPAATASLLLNLELVATLLLAGLLFGEHIGRRVALGGACVAVAGVVLAWSDVPDLRLGALLVVGACACWGLDNCVTAGLDEVAPEHITLAKGVVAGGANLLLGLAIGGDLPGSGEVLLALIAGALGYGLSITLWVSGARDIGAARGQLVFSCAPFVGVGVAWAVFRDPVRGVELAALALAAVGIWTVLRSDHLHPHRHQPMDHEHEHSHDDPHHAHVHEVATPASRHTHRHRHDVLIHSHPHVPDLHHRHDH
jgi:drug/metabolite transporter (DMT)-like permease